MVPSPRWSFTILISALLATLIWALTNLDRIGIPERSVPKRPADVQPPKERFDEPDAAAAYQRMKRRGPSPDFDTVSAYRRAHAHLDSMPEHSIRFGGPIERSPVHRDASDKRFHRSDSLGEWEPLGPGNFGGRTRTLVIHPAQPEIMYAGGVSGGVWKTTDGGQSWTPLADEIANIAVNSMAIHPDNPDVIFVGTGEGYFREIVRGTWLPLRGAGIFKTDDGGETWSRLSSTTSSDFHWVNDLIISQRNPDVIYAATRTGVHLSEDGGVSWSHFLEPGVNGGCLDLALRTDMNQDWLFASCGTFEQATVYRRKMTRAGEWEAVLSEPEMGRTTLAIAPSRQNIIYALSASNVSGPDRHYEQALHAVYRSSSAGNPGSWNVRVDNTDSVKLNTLLLTNAISASYVDCEWGDRDSWTPMGWYCNVIAVDPVDPNVVWAAGVDLFRSDDGGRNWGLASYWWAASNPWNPSWVHADQHAIVFHPDYDGSAVRTMYSATDGGIFRTDNPNATVGAGDSAICDPNFSSVMFENLNHGFGITQFYHGAPYRDCTTYLGGTQDNGTLLGRDVRGFDGWEHINGGDGGYVAVDPDNTSTLYVESQWFGLRKSTNGGSSFADAINGISESYGNFLFITPFVMDPNDSSRLWTGGRRVWKTNNGADNWTAASTTHLGSAQVSALAVEPGNSDFVVIGTTDGFIYRNESAREAGPATIWQSSLPRVGFVSSVAFDPSSPGVVYATFAGFGGPHVWRSDDRAVNWTPIDGSGSAAVPDIPVHSIVVDPTNPRRLYLGTDLGVMTSIDGGGTWARENTGFANAVTEWLALDIDDQGVPWLFAFTHGRGAWRVPLKQLPPTSRRPAGRRGPP
jgi:photosystem II stability/assembly factor-like uncharacterized protein